ncbi:hypothetical protein BDP81DRAFT_403669 [Colletotrichum phormii]|uniref:Uncharacterized protein n=1 Tax=Colletotrichum phormii TaxID=359342 RepID=A0AAJ0EH89_9PEZI|nr:uncharacterized protein BDP81DRAFT_403669 [Colletotrichum phormii]KAK1640177.1 hypothetical protein BDP81DRAFT_403669 [Colletotrichum phormii]
MPRFVIGVLGDTGSEKSSPINAVLDEERVVPTNCMRACTAVIMEISWNDSDNPNMDYRAEIDFITQAEWTAVVAALHRDILDNRGMLSVDIRNADSDAGIAYSVLKAVYPKHSDKQLRFATPEVLANSGKVREVFVDPESKRNVSGAEVEDAEPQEPEMAYWPLIKVVPGFLKSEVVSTGMVIPRGRHTNATRATVATKYLKDCSRLWVVALITRTVDDKTAKTLVEDHCTQQLKYDGAYNNITFDSAFNGRLPEKLTTLAASCKQLIESFHERMKDRRFLVGNNDLVNGFLVVILAAQKEKLAPIAKEHQKLVQSAQKDANRLFGPVFREAMIEAYQGCVDLRAGTRSFILMKDLMREKVGSQKSIMFKTAAGDVEKAANAMLSALEKAIRDDTNRVVNAMQEDYIGLIGEVATTADNRARKVLSPVLHEFYMKLNDALTPAKEEAVAPEPIDLEIDVGDGSDDEYRPDEGMSD